MMHSEAPMEELKAAPVSLRTVEQISHARFSPVEDLLWSGTEAGWLYATQVPELERYSCVRGHKHRIADLVPLPASHGGSVLSVSADSVRCHASGGMAHFTHTEEAQDLMACAVDPTSPHRAVLGHLSGTISTLDLGTGKLINKAGSVADGIQLIRAPAPRGIAALGCSNGSVVLADARSGFKAEATLSAHAGGLVAMDLGGSLLATAGLGTRQGHLVQDTIVKVYDLRATPRVLTTVPFSAGPQLLRFHPRISSKLLIAAAAGAFSLVDIQGSPYAPVMQVETEGDLLTSADFSSSGECLAFGGSGGFVHLWAFHNEPRVNLRSSRPEVPPAEPLASLVLGEDDSFAAFPLPYPPQDDWLSDWESSLAGSRNLPPRIVDLSRFSNLKQADFVTYIPNPSFRRHQPYGVATRAVASLRNQRRRLQASRDSAPGDGNGSSGRVLSVPQHYAKVHITVDADRRYEEFNFGKHNHTRFAGLENGIANCYANALVQVLYFTPQMRAFLLALVPEAGLEFSLLDELSLLFRMLARESGLACQAANLLHALRQSREALGLGLLEGHAQKGAHGADIEVEANKDRSLARRIQSLHRFLLDKLHQEAGRRKELVPSTGGGEKGPGVRNSTVVESVFGIPLRQRMQSLQGAKPAVERDSLAFQVGLQYPRRAKPAAKPGQAKPTDSQYADGPRPAFKDVLLASLRAESEMRAWFNDELKYQYVRQTRTLLGFPQVLAVGTGLQDKDNLHWWQSPQLSSGGERAWAPYALALDLKDGELAIDQADSLAELPAAKDDSSHRAVYELTAVVALVDDEDADKGEAQGDLPQADDGHLVAHVRVPPSYLDRDVGLLPTPKAQPGSPGLTPMARSNPWDRPSAQPLSEDLRRRLLEEQFAAAGSGEAQEREGAAKEHGLPDDLFASDGEEDAPVRPDADSSTAGGTAERVDAADLHTAVESTAESDSQLGASPPLQPSELPQQLGRLKVAGEARSDSQSVWLLINDFRIIRTPPAEVLQLFNGHKRPCLLYYTQVAALEEDGRRGQRVAPAEVLTPAAFHSLARAPALQAAVGRRTVKPPPFIPLEPGVEEPRAGLLLALDAEFVAFAPPAKALRGGIEVETAPSRLGLARVSVVRGEGPLAGQACIDDYIRCTEPVYDHLTQFSGLRPGDLDPERSPHHLTTLKAAYLKLRYLVDAGCVFVGHGLKKDFRMINVVVPPEQVVDTVDLFYLKRQRKLSLRFLSAYLLGQNIQTHTHDSIEDACTALSLYKVYRKLAAEGRLREVLQEMYAWGKQHGWDPAALSQQPGTDASSPTRTL